MMVRLTEDKDLGCNKEFRHIQKDRGIVTIILDDDKTTSHSSNQDHIYCGMESIHHNEGKPLQPLYYLCPECYLKTIYPKPKPGGDDE